MTKIRSVRILSAAKVNAVLHGILGLLLAPVVLIGPGLATAGQERGGFGGAIIAAAMMPFFSAVIGFLLGALLAFIYNAISHAIGGIELELDYAAPALLAVPAMAVAPPAPQSPPPLDPSSRELESTDVKHPQAE